MYFLDPSLVGLLLKGENLLLREQILSFKSNAQFLSDTVSTVKQRVKSKFGSVKQYGKM